MYYGLHTHQFCMLLMVIVLVDKTYTILLVYILYMQLILQEIREGLMSIFCSKVFSLLILVCCSRNWTCDLYVIDG